MNFYIITTVFLMIFINISYARALNYEPDYADTLITKHLQESGGSDALMKVKSISRYGNIAFYAENKLKDSYCYHTDIVYSTKLREQIKGKEIQYDRGTDGISFWLWTGAQYEFTKDTELTDYMLGTAERANRELLWLKEESDRFDMISTPFWAPQDSQCIQVVQSKDKIKRIYCFDTTTGLRAALGDDNRYRLETDWRQVGNIKLPFRLTDYQNGSIVFEVQLERVEVDRAISNSQFVKPDSPQLSC